MEGQYDACSEDLFNQTIRLEELEKKLRYIFFKFLIRVGPYIRRRNIALFVNLGMLELTYIDANFQRLFL